MNLRPAQALCVLSHEPQVPHDPFVLLKVVQPTEILYLGGIEAGLGVDLHFQRPRTSQYLPRRSLR